MPKITLTFEGDSWDDVVERMRVITGGSSTSLAFPDFEAPPTASSKREPIPEPEPEPAPAPKGKKARAAAALPVPEPEPEPEPAPAPAAEIPTLESLKAFVTQAVRAGQKGEGSTKINGLLPGFKAKTGLDFIMNAEEKHRQALYELAVEAGLA